MPRKTSKGARTKVYEESDKKCFYCERELPLACATADHVIPRVVGGLNYAENYVIACAYCNVDRGNVPFLVFLLTEQYHRNPLILDEWKIQHAFSIYERAIDMHYKIYEDLGRNVEENCVERYMYREPLKGPVLFNPFEKLRRLA